MTEPLGLATIGCGIISESHMSAMRELDSVRLVAAMDIDAERAERARQRFGADAAYDRLDSLWADDRVGGVVVCTPHAYHRDAVLAAAEHGKHVLVEKPMALSLADSDQMIRACAEAGVVLMVGQVFRYWPTRRKARAMLADGAIGRPTHVTHRRMGRFRCDGNPWPTWYRDPAIGGNTLLYGFGTHEYDIVHWLLGRQVRRVFAAGVHTDDYWDGDDEVSSILTFEDGAVAAVSQSINAATGQSDTTIIGTSGTLYIQGDQLLLDGTEVPNLESNSGAMRSQMADFAECAQCGGTPDADGRSVRHTMAILEAVKLSIARGQPVDLREVEG